MMTASPARQLRRLTLGLVIAAAACSGQAAMAQNWQSIPANPNITINYVPPTSADLQGVYQRLKARQVLEEYQHFLAPVRLPHPLKLQAGQCNAVNAEYSSTDRSLTICYEIVDWLEKQAPQTVSADGFITRQVAITGGLIGVMLHETGHMLFDMFDVPVFGREEDAADETASFFALQFSKDVEVTLIKGIAYEWAIQKDPAASAPISVYSDEHGTASQRMYNSLCLAYGGDPQTFQEFVDKGYLPKTRAPNCAAEFGLAKYAFETTIFPFFDADLMKRVKQTQWLTPEETK
jgi:hypothetical protein